MGREFLEKLGIGKDNIPQNWGRLFDKRRRKWYFQRKKYGFDERDTWDLNVSLPQMIYERIKLFDEITEEFIDKEFHKEQYRGQTITMQEGINLMLAALETNLKSEYNSEEAYEAYREFLELYMIFHPYLWW